MLLTTVMVHASRFTLAFSLYCLNLAKACAMIPGFMNIPFTRSRGLGARVVCLGLATLVLSTVASAQAQVVTFPDPNLEAAVRDALQIYAPTHIYQTNLSSTSFTNLSANGRGIVDLTGLQYATNLTLLQMQGNFGQPGLTDISILTNFQKLTWLEIPYNRVTNGSPVAGLTNLTYLDIGWNRDATDNSIRDMLLPDESAAVAVAESVLPENQRPGAAGRPDGAHQR